jgi:putative inorganic carbon (HCO3(-)) transporter
VEVVQTVVLVAAAALAGWFILRADPAWTLSASLALSVFSGRWVYMGVPLPLDRVLLVSGAAVLLLRIGAAKNRPPLRLGIVHVLLFAVVVMAVVSALWAGTLGVPETRIDILDRLGVIPFIWFAIAPVAFYDVARRKILLGMLVGLGFYLGLTSLFEGLGVEELVWPGFIVDPDIGSFVERARGPFLESVGNGVTMIGCATAAVIALAHWRDRLARGFAYATIGLCLAGIVLTYTRSVWIAAVVGVFGALLAFPDVRPKLAPAVVAAAVALGVATATVPGLSDKLSDRFTENGPVWVRQHTNAAALRMIAEKPVLGYGWRTFQRESGYFFRDIGETKLTGFHEIAHNIFLVRVQEVGLLGGALWFAALALAFGAPVFRRATGELALWQRGYVVVILAMVVVALFTHLGFPFQGSLIGAWAGLLLVSSGRDPAPG